MKRDVHDALSATAAATRRDRLLIAARRGQRMEGLPDQQGALFQAAAALDQAGIAYALIGGIAVGIHSGVPRATQDVDVAVPSDAAREAVIRAMSDATFEFVGEYPHSLNFRHPSGEPVQASMDPVFDDMIERAEAVDAGGMTIRIVTKADLIAMKERSAADPRRRRSEALRDRADLELLRGDVPDPDEGW